MPGDPQQPFFVWFNTTRMHVFRHLKKESVGKTGKGMHADGMAEHDGHVGELLDLLDQLEIDDNTIVVYTTDNGAELALWPDGAMTMFRGEKGSTWEGGLRIPMAIKWPGVIKPGTVSNEIISLLAAGSHRQLGEEVLLRLREVPVSGGTALNAGSINYTRVRTKEALERLGKLETLHPAS